PPAGPAAAELTDGDQPRPAPASPLSAAAGPHGPGGRPDQTERPHPRRRGHPINHHVTGAAHAPRTKVRLAAPARPHGRHGSTSPAQKGRAPGPLTFPTARLPALPRQRSEERRVGKEGK